MSFQNSTEKGTSKRKRLVEKIRRRRPAEHALHLRFEDVAVEVRADREKIISELYSYFRPFLSGPSQSHIRITCHQGETVEAEEEFIVKMPDPGKHKIKEEYIDLPDGRVVRKRLTGLTFVFGEGDNLVAGPCLENLNQVVNFINSCFISVKLKNGCFLGHAAAVAKEYKGLAIAGRSGAGKSTVALELLNNELRFLSNDRILIKRKSKGLSVLGVAKLPRINPGTALNNPSLNEVLSEKDKEKYRRLKKEDLLMVEHKHDVDIDACFGKGKMILKAPLSAIAVINWDSGPCLCKPFKAKDRPDLIKYLMKSPGLFYRENISCFNLENYVELLGDCPLYEISGKRNFQAAAKSCLRIINSETAES